MKEQAHSSRPPGPATSRPPTPSTTQERPPSDRPGLVSADRCPICGPQSHRLGSSSGRSVPRLLFEVLGAEVDDQAATPSIALRLGVSSPSNVPIRSAVMQAQVRLHLGRRAVDDATRERIATSFGAGDDDQRSPAPLLWTRTSVTIPPFVGKTQVSISLPCTYDVEVATSAWLDQLPGGVMPLEISLDGTIFYRGEDGAVHSAMAPWWEHEIGFDLPVARWREALDRFFPESAWIRMGRRRFERLDAIRRREGLEDWDETIDALLRRYPSKNEAS